MSNTDALQWQRKKIVQVNPPSRLGCEILSLCLKNWKKTLYTKKTQRKLFVRKKKYFYDTAFRKNFWKNFLKHFLKIRKIRFKLVKFLTKLSLSRRKNISSKKENYKKNYVIYVKTNRYRLNRPVRGNSKNATIRRRINTFD